MTNISNHAYNWSNPEIQPWVLGGLSLISIGFFTYKIWKKFKVLSLAQPENRFEKPGKRFLHMLWVAFGQAKLFKKKTSRMDARLHILGFLYSFI